MWCVPCRNSSHWVWSRNHQLLCIERLLCYKLTNTGLEAHQENELDDKAVLHRTILFLVTDAMHKYMLNTKKNGIQQQL